MARRRLAGYAPGTPDADWRNYPLFLDGDGLLVGYFECDDFDVAPAWMALTAVNARWQEEMTTLFDDSGQPPDPGVCAARRNLQS